MINPLRPIITICGTTGVGKSKLAIELAQRLNQTSHSSNSNWRRAKIINVDAMQVYKGLDVITNKIPMGERQGIPHLLMDFKKPGEQYVVGEWVLDTLELIDEMHRNNELPIIVGGTSYWIQHLIFPNRLVSKEVSDSPQQQLPKEKWSQHLQDSVASLPEELLYLLENLPQEAPSAKVDPDEAFKLHQLLSLLDPVISERWHWKDTRKVLRNLEIVKESGKRPSDIILEQATSTTDNKPRFNTLCFWLYAEPTELGPRLDSRVDDMIKQGLLEEVKSLRQTATTNLSTNAEIPGEIDYTLGIYQSIGYKEFCGYLDAPTDASLQEATYRMKLSTRQYAKRQISWIRNQLIPAIKSTATSTTAGKENANSVHMYLLDATTLGDDWLTNVQLPAVQIQEAFLSGEELPDPSSLSETASKMLNVRDKNVNPTSKLQARKRRVCSACTTQDDRPVMIEEGAEWERHTNTRSHRGMVARRNKPTVDYSRFKSKSSLDDRGEKSNSPSPSSSPAQSHSSNPDSDSEGPGPMVF